MKKILAFVLALVMVLGMATIVSAATKVTAKVEKWVDNKDGTQTITVKVTTDGKLGKLTLRDNSTAPQESGLAEYEWDEIPFDGVLTYTGYSYADKLFFVAYDEDGNVLETITLEKPADKRVIVNEEVLDAMRTAILTKSDTVVIDLTNVYKNTITTEDWGWMLNNINSMRGDVDVYARNRNGDVSEEPYDVSWWNNQLYLNMNIKLVDGTTIFYIDAADIDYTWTKAVCFDIDDGLTYDGYTKAEIFAAIRKLSGDTKNPYTFGFMVPSKVPTMTVSYVIPQQWINVYGHKNLALWAYSSVEEKCEACGAKHEEFKVLETTTLDAVTQTQRITFETNEFFRTLVLSKTAASTAADNTNKTDANPNTGANDIVNVAIVFSVISLVAAGAFVFSKQR